jgi:uncharacterized protein with HEPN domain
MRTDDILLLDMLVAAQKLQRFLLGRTLEGFRSNEMAQSTVIRELQVIREAAGNISNETQVECAEIEWHAIVGLRNRLVHEYFAIRSEILWEIVHDDIPPLIVHLKRYLSPDVGQEES